MKPYTKQIIQLLHGHQLDRAIIDCDRVLSDRQLLDPHHIHQEPLGYATDVNFV